MKVQILMACMAAVLTLGAAAPAKAKAAPAKKAKPVTRVVMQAENAIFDASRMQIIDRDKFSGKKGLMLADGQKSMLDNPDLSKPDAVFKFKIEKAGIYWIRTAVDTTGEARKAMEVALTKKNKYDSLQMRFTIDGGILRSRYIISPWEDLTYRSRNLMKWNFTPGEHEIKIWLPKDAGLDMLTVELYRPPYVPAAVKKYTPSIIPGPRPRLWVTPQTLPMVKANLTKGENKAVWEKVQAKAAEPFAYTPKKGVEGEFNAKLHDACINKAFVYLMTGDKKFGKDAIALMDAYMGVVEFSNLLDITREIGQVIYSGSLVYDWCYDLLTVEQRKSFRDKLLRLAMDMEIGWPPFLQTIVNGHGNELQVNRDLLSMSIALFGDDDEPYRYCAYRILEELVPMRAEEYKSGRHNQGVGYAAFRFNAEMHAVWLMRRLANKEVFDPNIKSLGYYWTYGQYPDGRIMTDGDGSITSSAWAAPDVMFMCYSYSNDPVLKGEYIRQGATMTRPCLFLLLNDPDLKADMNLAGLPLSRNFPGVLPSIIARTGWDIGATSSDVMVEMKGGDTHFGNHQHADAGAFQIFYRGELATDLGMYGFYGTLYDMGYNKRSIAHNVMLAYDPTEVFRHKRFANDGGQRFIQEHPRNVREINKPVFRYGKTLATYVGPNTQRPFFSYIWSDLTKAYSDKVEGYTRGMCFVNLADQDCPAALIVVDRMTTRHGIKKYWTVNSLTKPEETARGVDIYSKRDFMRGKLSVNMFLPREIKKEIAGGGKATSFFGQTLTPPLPTATQAQGYRTMISDANEQDTALFAAVMLIGAENGKKPQVTCKQNWNNIVFTINNRIVVMPSVSKPQDTGFRFTVPAGKDKTYYCLLTGLQTGLWNICSLNSKKLNVEATVTPEEGSVFLQLEPGEYQATPGASADEIRYTAPTPAVPKVADRYADSVYVNGKKLENSKPSAVGKVLFVPAIATAKALGGKAVVSGDYLNTEFSGMKVVFKKNSNTVLVNGKKFSMNNRVTSMIDGVWYVDGAVLAGFGNAHFLSDIRTNSAIMQSRKTADSVLWLNSDCDFTRDAWTQMQGTGAKGGYWAVHGKGRWFEVTFRNTQKLNGIGIDWSQGAARKAKFKLEVNDGNTWKTVYDGWSYKKGGLEVYPFPAQEVRQIRWTGYGNSLNEWNSIFSFVPQVVK